MFHQEFKEYWKEVEQFLTCSRASRKKFYTETLEAANRFVEENPGVAFAQVEEYLGSPQELAENYLETISAIEIQRFFQKRKVGKLLLISLVLIIIASFGVLFFSVSKEPIDLVHVDTVIIDEGDISNPESSLTEE